MGALRGKLSKLFGSTRAQIMALGLYDLVRVVSENFEHFSSIGELKIENKNGRNSLTFRAASDQLSEAGGAEQNWTFRVDLGDEGKLLNIRVTTPDDSRTLAQLKMSSDGYVTLYGNKGINIGAAGERRGVVGGDDILRINGAQRKKIDGSVSVEIGSDRKESISNSDSKTIGVDSISMVNRNKATSIGGQKIETIVGGLPTNAKPGNVAAEIKVLNGNYIIHVGNPKDGALPTAKAGYRIYTYSGPIVLGMNPTIPSPLTSISLNTIKNDSIGLGCMAPSIGGVEAKMNPATDYAMLYNRFNAMFKACITLLDSHTHDVIGVKTGPALAPAAGGFNLMLSPMLPLIKSIRVRIGA
jgi:hypothetical protein